MRTIYLHGLGQTPADWENLIAREEFAENSVCPDLTELCQGKQVTYQNVLFHFMPNSMFQQTGFGKKEFIQLCKTMMKLDFSSSIQGISCPTLVVCGERDTANKKASTELASLLKNADLQIIRDSGHEVNMEAPERLAQALCVFYKRVQ